MPTNDEIKHNIKQTEDYLAYLKAIEVVASKAAEATARMYTESEVDKMLNESSTEGYKDGEKAERQRCIDIVRGLKYANTEKERIQYKKKYGWDDADQQHDDNLDDIIIMLSYSGEQSSEKVD